MIIWNLLFYAVLCFRLINIYVKANFFPTCSLFLPFLILHYNFLHYQLEAFRFGNNNNRHRRPRYFGTAFIWFRGWIDWLSCVIHNTRIIGINIFLFRIDWQNPSKWFITNAGFMFYPVGKHCGGGNLWGCCADAGQRWEGERPESWLGSWLPPQWWEWHSAEWAERSLVIFKTEFIYII